LQERDAIRIDVRKAGAVWRRRQRVGGNPRNGLQRGRARAACGRCGDGSTEPGRRIRSGVRRDLQDRLVRDGYRMRVYVPFGTQWYPYLMRRLAERPANVAFLTGNVVKEMVGRRRR